MNLLLPDSIDVLLEDLGYHMTMGTISAAVDQCVTSDISAIGLDNAELDKDKIIKYLVENGMYVTTLDIRCSRNVVTSHVIGQKQPVVVDVGHDITLDLTCYTDSIPADCKVLTPYARTIPLEPEIEIENDNFDLGGAL